MTRLKDLLNFIKCRGKWSFKANKGLHVSLHDPCHQQAISDCLKLERLRLIYREAQIEDFVHWMPVE